MTLTRRGALTLLGTAGGTAVIADRAWSQSNPFKIGVVASMTGPASPFFREYVDAFRAYVTVWNKNGGVKGRPVVLEILDDESGAVQALSAYKRLAGDRETMTAWVANPGAAGLAIKAIASEVKLPVVSGGALDQLGVPADPYFFKISPANSSYAKLFFEWVKSHDMKRVALLLSNDAYGQGEAQTAKEQTQKLGLEIAGLETFSPSDTSFSSQLARLRGTAHDILYIGASGAAGILIFKQIRQFNLKPPIAFMLAALTDAFFQAIGGAEKADGIVTPGLLGMLGARAEGASGVLYGKLAEALGRPGSLGNALGWDIGIVTQAAIEGSDATRSGIRDALDRTRELPGINGPINFTPANHIAQDVRGMAMMKLAGGKFVYADASS